MMHGHTIVKKLEEFLLDDTFTFCGATALLGPLTLILLTCRIW